jgi:DNA-binding winged helix-turn-helix (wHTH) protein/Flp pilus assembly protein TadD
MQRHWYHFGPYRMDPLARTVLRDDQPLVLTPKAVDTLRVLVQNGGKVVSKDTLLGEIWPGSFVGESSLTRNISDLRRVLGGARSGRTVIETVSKRGYRLVLPVKEHQEAEGFARKTIAILPLKVMGRKKAGEDIGLRIADALITKLATVRGCMVRPTSAVTKYRSAQEKALTVGRRLKAEYVLDGSIKRQAEKMRVTFQLLETKNAALVWAETLEEKSGDGFGLEDSIAEELAGALTLLLGTDQRKLLDKRYTNNSDAYRLHLRGRYHWNLRSEPAIKEAIRFFRKALEIDPEYAPAYSALASSYALLPMLSRSSARQLMPKAKAAAISALDIDATLAEARSALALVKWHYDWDWTGAEREFRRILKFQPDDAVTHQWYAMLLVELGRSSEAIAKAKRAQALDPSSSIHANAAMVLHLAGRYDAAIEGAREALDLEPNSLRARLSLGLALEQKGLLKEAIETFNQGGGVSGQVPSHASALGHCYARAGNIREAESALKSLEKASPSGYLWQALIHLGLGHEGRAVDLLEQAREEKEFEVVLLKVDKRFGPLRANPRFQMILEQVGLSDAPSTG